MSCEDIDQGVGDDAEGDAFCDGVGKGHGDDGKVAGDGFGKVIEFDSGDCGEHEEAYGDQGRRGRKGGNGHENRGKENGKEEKNGGCGGS